MSIVIPNSKMLREPNLLVPGRKPAGPVKLNRSHPMVRGCVAYVIWYGTKAIDYITESLIKNISVTGVRIDSVNDGQTADITGTNYYEIPHRDELNVTGDCTLITKMVEDTFSTSSYSSFGGKESGNGATNNPFGGYLFNNSGVPEIQTLRANTNYGLAVFGPLSFTGASTIAIVQPEEMSSIPRCYENGNAIPFVKWGRQRSGTATGNTKPIRLGRRDDGAVTLDGTYAYWMLFNRMLTQEEVIEVYRNPYAPLMPA